MGTLNYQPYDSGIGRARYPKVDAGEYTPSYLVRNICWTQRWLQAGRPIRWVNVTNTYQQYLALGFSKRDAQLYAIAVAIIEFQLLHFQKPVPFNLFRGTPENVYRRVTEIITNAFAKNENEDRRRLFAIKVKIIHAN